MLVSLLAILVVIWIIFSIGIKLAWWIVTTPLVLVVVFLWLTSRRY